MTTRAQGTAGATPFEGRAAKACGDAVWAWRGASHHRGCKGHGLAEHQDHLLVFRGVDHYACGGVNWVCMHLKG